MNLENDKTILMMTNALRHRGPDDEGYIAINTETLKITELIGNDSVVSGININDFKEKANLYLGHRRLSIIDPTPAGHQPMANDDSSIWIIFNGEIYNYIEIREELKVKGYNFKTSCDTEVIIKAYEEWDFECLHKFNGMWAFVIYDSRKNILFGARDRFGVKPLYYYLDNNHFAFASEIKALLKIPFYERKINEKAVFDYLVLNLEEYESESFFKNIFELKPANYFVFDLKSKKLNFENYYKLDYLKTFASFDEKKLYEYKKNVRSRIFDAINIRLRSDVPIGTCLSGGIDSSTVVCVINDFLKQREIEQIGKTQKVFTACYEDKSVDESKWAKIVVDHTNTDWFKTYPKAEELFNDLEDLIYYQDIPFGSTSIYAQYRVMKLAKENNVKVLLDGQGGDELFGGYHIYYKVYLAELISKGYYKTALREYEEIRKSGARPLEGTFKILLTPFIPAFLKDSFGKLKYPALRYLNDDFAKRFTNRVFVEENSNSLNEFLQRHMTYLNLKTLLKYEDRNSMRFSIEARTPFADDMNLIEYVFKIPSAYKIHNGWTKYLMRTSMEGILPKEIQWRRDKIGFATPEKEWLQKNSNILKSYIRKELSDYLNLNKILNAWENLITLGNADVLRFIWRLVNLSLWYKKFFNKKN
jgi:asparagine synthase (glutamine-hydrolysing)